MRRNQLLTLLSFLAIGFFAIGLVLLFNYKEQVFFMIPIAIGVSIFIVIIVIASKKRVEPPISIQQEEEAKATEQEKRLKELHKERKRLNDLYKQQRKQALQVAQGKQEGMQITKNLSVIEYTGSLTADVCMVCKLFLNDNDKILQCPICESLYHRDHLLEWVKVKKRCPVCSQVLYKKQGEK